MKYTTVLFDLDGTIIDSSQGVTGGVAHALDHYGVPYASRKELECFIGPPLKDTFATFCGISEEKALEYVDVYREYYKTIGVLENTVYDGIEELLKGLKENGAKIGLATAKPEGFAIQILEHIGLSKYFDFIGGASFDTSRPAKPDVLKYVIEKMEITDKSSAVLIGDSTHDVLGAKAVGIEAIAVSYGFCTIEKLEESKPLAICGSATDVLDFLLK